MQQALTSLRGRVTVVAIAHRLSTIRAADDIVVLTNSGGRSAFGNVGATTRRGAELSLDWESAYALRFSGLTPNQRRFLQPDAAALPARTAY